jgi:Flp pilus assembly protein TadG
MTLTIQIGGRGVNANSKRESSRWGRFKAALKCRLASGVRDERGAAAVMFGLSMMLLLPLTLGMVDIYLASNQRNQLQDALDAATLYAAKSSEQTNAGIQTVGAKALSANLILPPGVTLVSATFSLVGTKVVAHAETTAPALAAGLWPHANVKADAEVQRAMDKLEIALVLDNTGSMQDNNKLTTLQTSAKSLVDKLAAAAGRSSDPNAIKIALVPFSNTVRALDTVDLSGYSTTNPTGTVPAWIDPKAQAQWDADTSTARKYYAFNVVTDRLLMMKQMGVKWAGCVESRMQPYDIKEDSANTATKTSMFVPYFWPDEPDTNSYNNYKTDVTPSTDPRTRQRYSPKYTGSAPTGTFAMDSTAYGTPYNLGPNAGCTLQPLIRLTTNMQTIKDGIDKMKAMGETDIPIGMVWGWHALSPTGVGPFGDGAAYNTLHLRKIIILMTDGENTMNDPSKSNESNGSFYGGYGYIWQNMLGIASGSSSARTTAIDNRLTALCANVKAKNITVYTVRVEVTTGTSTLLLNCASTPDKFYDVKNVSQLGAAFDAIAGSIDNLRLSK